MSAPSQNPIIRYFAEFGVLRDCGKSFWLSALIQILEGLGYASLIHILILYLGKYCGFTDSSSTYWVGMYTLFLSMFVMAVGSVCDIIGLKKTYTIGFAVLILGRVLMGIGTDLGMSFFGMTQSDSSIIVIVGIVLMAFGTAFMSPCLSTSFRRFTTIRARATGFNIWYLAANVGYFFAALAIVDPLRDVFGETNSLIWIVNIGTFCYALAYIFTRLIDEDDYAVPSERLNVEESSNRRPLVLIKEVIRERAFQKLLLFLFLTLGVRLVFTIQFLVMPQYYTRTVGDDFSLGILQSFNPAIIVIGLVAIIPLLNRFSTVNLMISGMTISAFSLVFMAVPAEWYFILPGVDTLPQAYFLAIVIQILVFSFGELLFSPRFTEYVARVAPKDKVASYMSLSGLPMFIAQPINGVIGGLMVSYLCYNGISMKMDTEQISFAESPEMMWLVYLAIATVSPIAIIATRRMFTTADEDVH